METSKTFFEKNKLGLDNKKILVAASAGPDSMALAEMMRQLVGSENLILGHVDHQLREDSYLESEILEEYAAKHNIRLIQIKWDHEANLQSGIEAKAREFRYGFFRRIIAQEKIDYLLTAHHGDDLLENILLKLIRSGNVSEMNNLKAVGDFAGIKIIRPLLSWSKNELLEYDRKHNLKFVEDHTNQEDDTARNRLRHHVIPLLKKENNNLIENGQRFLHSEELLEQERDSLFSGLKQPEWVLGSLTGNLKDLENLTFLEKKDFFEWLIWQNWQKKVHFPNEESKNYQRDGFCLYFYQGKYFIWKNQESKNSGIKEISLEENFDFENSQYVISTKTEIAGMKKIDYFYYTVKAKFFVGSLNSGSRLAMADGRLIKPKKKFAENVIPLPLRKRCLTVLADQEIVFLERCYRWQKRDENYICYNIFKKSVDNLNN